MPQTKWERGFWASVRGRDRILPNGKEFKPFPQSHWYKKKTGKKTAKHKKYITKGHDGKPVTILESVNHYVNNDDAQLLLL